MVFYKSVWNVLPEAFIVGIILALVFIFIKYLFTRYIPNFKGDQMNIVLVLISGSVFHILFEYTGINLWYSKKYCKLSS